MAQNTIKIMADSTINWFTVKRRNNVTITVSSGNYLEVVGFEETGDYIEIVGVDPKDAYTYPAYYEQSSPSYEKVQLDVGTRIYFDADKVGFIRCVPKTIVTYEIEYKGNGATSGSTAKQSGAVTYTIRQNGFRKTGFTFKYWIYGIGTKYYPGDSVTPTRNMILNAYWERNKYTITYDAYGGSNAPEDQTKYYDIDLQLSSNEPTWANHHFAGWSKTRDRIDANIDYIAGGTYKENASATLYAVWQCIISYYSKGQHVNDAYYRIGQTATIHKLPDTETELFAGWQYGEEVIEGGATRGVTGNMSLYAIWKPRTYTITYHGNNETGGSTEEQSGSMSYIIRRNGFYKTGKVFIYWRTATGIRYYPNDSVTPSENMHLYAEWKTKEYFYWHGSDSADATYFAVGKRIDLAITARAWNRLYDFINEVRRSVGLPAVSFTYVSADSPIKAITFNNVRNAINQLIGAGYGSDENLPSTVSTGQVIVTTLFNGPCSLKSAINSAVDAL